MPSTERTGCIPGSGSWRQLRRSLLRRHDERRILAHRSNTSPRASFGWIADRRCRRLAPVSNGATAPGPAAALASGVGRQHLRDDILEAEPTARVRSFRIDTAGDLTSPLRFRRRYRRPPPAWPASQATDGDVYGTDSRRQQMASAESSTGWRPVGGVYQGALISLKTRGGPSDGDHRQLTAISTVFSTIRQDVTGAAYKIDSSGNYEAICFLRECGPREQVLPHPG